MGLDKRFLISVVAVFFISMGLGFVIHGILLHADYGQLPDVMRSQEDAQSKMPFMLAAHLLIAAGFTWIYRMGRGDRPWLGQGIRFGAAWVVAVMLPWYMIYHAVAQFPLSLSVKQMIFDSIGVLIMAAAVAFIHRDEGDGSG